MTSYTEQFIRKRLDVQPNPCKTGGMPNDTESPKLSRPERNFAAEVKRLREEAGWSQTELAERLRRQDLPYVNQATVSRIENASRPVRLMEAQAISAVFRVTVAQMTDPDASDVFLGLMEINERQDRTVLVTFKDSLREVARRQVVAEHEGRTLSKMAADRSTTDPEMLHRYDNLILNRRNFAEMNLQAEARSLIEQGRKDGSSAIRSMADSRTVVHLEESESERKLRDTAEDLSAKLREKSMVAREAQGSSQRG